MSNLVTQPDKRGHFGPYGGMYVPETLMAPLTELAARYEQARKDPSFKKELAYYLREFVGRPTPLFFARRISEELGGLRVYFKREDLCHTGAHKINNSLGQVLLAKRMGKSRIIAETGAGQHGVATATVSAMFGLDCVIYMGKVDMERQALNVSRMRRLGAEVVAVTAGQQTLKEAISEAMRDWVTNVRNTHYIIGSALGAHPSSSSSLSDTQAASGTTWFLKCTWAPHRKIFQSRPDSPPTAQQCHTSSVPREFAALSAAHLHRKDYP